MELEITWIFKDLLVVNLFFQTFLPLFSFILFSFAFVLFQRERFPSAGSTFKSTFYSFNWQVDLPQLMFRFNYRGSRVSGVKCKIQNFIFFRCPDCKILTKQSSCSCVECTLEVARSCFQVIALFKRLVCAGNVETQLR